MKFKNLFIFCLFTWLLLPFNNYAIFIAERKNLEKYYDKSDIVMIASTGRSASTMLVEQLRKHIRNPYRVLKTHLLPPDARFKGKIIFIFSNPDQTAESALHKMYERKSWGERHFRHVETVDREWLKRIGGVDKQTEKNNLLSYDALGIYKHLEAWLYTQTEQTDLKHAQILAIKYENLWDRATVLAIRQFLNIPNFKLPPKHPRRYTTEEDLYPKEIAFRRMYNLGTEENPRYAVYDEARVLWEQAPPFQYLKICF